MLRKINKNFDFFAECAIDRATKIADRAVAFLYFRFMTTKNGATIKQIISDFEVAGLGKQNVTRLRKTMRKDPRVVKFGKDGWILRGDKIKEVELKFNLSYCLKTKKPIIKGNIKNGKQFVDSKRIKELKGIKNDQFDFSRLILMTEELNDAFSKDNYLTVIFFIRAIIDHVPPVFNCKTFSEVANNYKGPKSFKDLMITLDTQSRKISDYYLHAQIRKKEFLPNEKQINFSGALDFLLAEIIGILYRR